MSRAWKKPNHSLPGWHSYSAPQPKKRRNRRRRWKGEVLRARKLVRREIARMVSKHQPVATRYLILETGHVSVWKRRHGVWRCIASGPPYEWFLRVRHPEKVGQFLRSHHITFIQRGEPPPPVCLSDCGSASAMQSESSPGATATAPSGDISKRGTL